MADQFAGGILAGSQSVSIPVILRVKSDGAELTGKAAANMSAYYWRQGATGVQQITLATLGSVGAVFFAGGWFEVDGTNFKGAYRMDLPNTAVSTGAEWVTVGVKDTAASGFYFYERFALETKHINSLQDLAYADVKSAASSAWNAAAGTNRVTPADGSITAAVLGADCITSAKVAAGAFTYDDQITTFKSELSGLIVGLPNGHITSAKIGADAFGSDKFAPGCLVYDDQITTFKSELSGLVITIPNGHITSAKIGADAIGSDKVGPGAFVYGDQITVFDASIQSAASAAWAAAALTNRVIPATGSITNAVFGTDVLTAAVFGADFLTSAKVAAGAFTYDDQLTTFKSEFSGLMITIPNGHITSAKIGADAIGSDKIAGGAIVYGDQLTGFDATIQSAASAALAAVGVSTLGVADIKSAASAAIAAYAPLTDKAEFRLSTQGVRDITQYTSAQGGVPGSSPSLYDAVVWNAAQSSFKRIQTPTTYLLHYANGTAFASAPVSGDSASVTIGVFTNV